MLLPPPPHSESPKSAIFVRRRVGCWHDTCRQWWWRECGRCSPTRSGTWGGVSRGQGCPSTRTHYLVTVFRCWRLPMSAQWHRTMRLCPHEVVSVAPDMNVRGSHSRDGRRRLLLVSQDRCVMENASDVVPTHLDQEVDATVVDPTMATVPDSFSESDTESLNSRPPDELEVELRDALISLDVVGLQSVFRRRACVMKSCPKVLGRPSQSKCVLRWRKLRWQRTVATSSDAPEPGSCSCCSQGCSSTDHPGVDCCPNLRCWTVSPSTVVSGSIYSSWVKIVQNVHRKHSVAHIRTTVWSVGQNVPKHWCRLGSCLLDVHWKAPLLLLGTWQLCANCRTPGGDRQCPDLPWHQICWPESQTRPLFWSDLFLNNLKCARRGAAGGPSGLNSEHLRSILMCPADSEKF